MRISEDAKKCVVFIGIHSPPTAGSAATSEIKYAGTGFLVSNMDADGDTFRYLITCRHVARNLEDEFFLRLNTVDGGAEDALIEQANWQSIPTVLSILLLPPLL